MWLQKFREIVLIDFEFDAGAGNTPAVRCMVAQELRGGRTHRLWEDALSVLPEPPFGIGPDVLFVAFYASAEVGCFLALDWPLPHNIFDLYVEYKNLTNGLRTPFGKRDLVSCLAHFGIDGIGAAEKQEMRDLVLRGGPYTKDEREAIIAYCESDVRALERLLPHVAPRVRPAHALLRGRFMRTAAVIERNGIPVDAEVFSTLKERWPGLKQDLIERLDADFGVFENGAFKAKRWLRWTQTNGITWPRLASGSPALDDDTFREMATLHSEIQPMRQLRRNLTKLRVTDLTVGVDGRNRYLMSAFQSKSSRNQPSPSKFIFGADSWLRSLVRPPPGRSLAYLDWRNQEFGIAAALSGDTAMKAAYDSGDPYLEFARMAGAVPQGATKQTHPKERGVFKQVTLGTQYSQGVGGLARRLEISHAEASYLLGLHHQVYHRFWDWSDAAVSSALFGGYIDTVFGWRLHVTADTNPRTLRNFPMQANGAEMLRLAANLAVERGVMVIACVHDALLVEAPTPDIDATVAETAKAMREASEVVLDGFPLGTDTYIVTHPDRFEDERGTTMWREVMALLERKSPRH